MDHVISIAPDGSITTLWTDKIDLREFGTPHVERASNVEWDERYGGWTVQFIDGSHLCATREFNPKIDRSMYEAPVKIFASRQAALEAEVEFLQSRM